MGGPRDLRRELLERSDPMTGLDKRKQALNLALKGLVTAPGADMLGGNCIPGKNEN